MFRKDAARTLPFERGDRRATGCLHAEQFVLAGSFLGVDQRQLELIDQPLAAFGTLPEQRTSHLRVLQL